MLRGDHAGREGRAVAKHRRMLGVELGDPDGLQAARRPAARDDRDRVAGIAERACVHADDLLDAAEDRRRGVMEEDDAEPAPPHLLTGAAPRATREPPPVTDTLRPVRRTRNEMLES